MYKGERKKMYESLKRSGVLTEEEERKGGDFVVVSSQRESALKNREVVCAEKS